MGHLNTQNTKTVGQYVLFVATSYVRFPVDSFERVRVGLNSDLSQGGVDPLLWAPTYFFILNLFNKACAFSTGQMTVLA